MCDVYFRLDDQKAGYIAKISGADVARVSQVRRLGMYVWIAYSLDGKTNAVASTRAEAVRRLIDSTKNFQTPS